MDDTDDIERMLQELESERKVNQRKFAENLAASARMAYNAFIDQKFMPDQATEFTKLYIKAALDASVN